MPNNKTSRRRRHLRFESLEDRRVMATWGIAWPDPQHLTASFVPDGTVLPGGTTSDLDQTLNAELGTGNWQAPILKALQTWAENSNINIGLVADGGQALGIAGPTQGDARFGDIRISAEPLPSDVVAITTPYGPTNGTLSGDIIFNSNDDFNPNDAGSYDLFTVALHEAGHVFGFADSSDPSNFMYNVYQGPQTSLAPAAISALQSLYGGPRTIDSIDGNPVSTNPSTPVSVPSPASNTNSVTLSGDLASAQSSNYFTFQAPGVLSTAVGVGVGVDVSVQTSGLSLLTPRLTVTNALGQVVNSATASGPLAGGTSVHLAALIPGQKYSIQVTGATGDAFSVGSYDLTVTSSISLAALASPIAGARAIPEPANYSGATPLTATNTISVPGQVDVYSFRTPTSTINGVTVALQDFGVGLASPTAALYDALGNLLATSAATASAGSASVSVHDGLVLPNTTYYLRVTSGKATSTGFGTYQATVSFTPPASAGSTAAFVAAVPWFGPSGVASPTNGTLQSAASLQPPPGYAPNSYYQAIDGVDPAQAQRFYKLTSPVVAGGQAEAVTVSVQTLDNGGLAPWVGVFDQNGNAQPEQVITEQGGVEVIQVALANPGTPYYVEVTAAGFSWASNSGNYDLNATFAAAQPAVAALASGTLPASPAGSSPALVSTTLSISQGELYQFVLVGSAANSSDAILQMTLLDSQGNVVATLSTPASLAESMIVTLPAGNFTVEIGAYSPSGQAIPPLAYSLSGTNLTDPIKASPTSGSGGATGGK